MLDGLEPGLAYRVLLEVGLLSGNSAENGGAAGAGAVSLVQARETLLMG